MRRTQNAIQKGKPMKIAALQLSNNKSQSEIESYLKTAVEAKAKIILFGEYLLNPFFKEGQVYLWNYQKVLWKE